MMMPRMIRIAVKGKSLPKYLLITKPGRLGKAPFRALETAVFSRRDEHLAAMSTNYSIIAHKYIKVKG